MQICHKIQPPQKVVRYIFVRDLPYTALAMQATENDPVDEKPSVNHEGTISINEDTYLMIIVIQMLSHGSEVIL